MDIRCPKCGELHTLSEMEPTYDYPDAYLAIPKPEREQRAFVSSALDMCAVFGSTRDSDAHFLRAVMPIRIRGEARPCHWGVWVKVAESDFARVLKLWDDPDQANEPPFRATLANDIVEYQPCLGLPGELRLTGPTTRPSFSLDSGVAHPLVIEQDTGVFPERVVEWLVRRIHH